MAIDLLLILTENILTIAVLEVMVFYAAVDFFTYIEFVVYGMAEGIGSQRNQLPSASLLTTCPTRGYVGSRHKR